MTTPSWLTFDSVASKFSYSISTNNSLVGIYTITVTFSVISFSFNIDVQSSCNVAVLAIDNTIFNTTSPAMTQIIWQTPLKTQMWTDGIVTV